jgi:hypothetical protein
LGGKLISGREGEAAPSDSGRTEKKEEVGETPTLQQLMAVMQQMQGELVPLKRKLGRNRQNGQRRRTWLGGDGTFEIGGRKANLLQLPRGWPHSKKVTK